MSSCSSLLRCFDARLAAHHACVPSPPSHAQVPAYASFIKERFERCLDLYLCPRTRRKRLIIEGMTQAQGWWA